MSPVYRCFTVALVTFGPALAPAGFSFQSSISKPPLATFFNVDLHHQSGQKWSGRPASNRLPQPWEGCALPGELRPRLAKTILGTRFRPRPRPEAPLPRRLSAPAANTR